MRSFLLRYIGYAVYGFSQVTLWTAVLLAVPAFAVGMIGATLEVQAWHLWSKQDFSGPMGRNQK